MRFVSTEAHQERTKSAPEPVLVERTKRTKAAPAAHQSAWCAFTLSAPSAPYLLRYGRWCAVRYVVVVRIGYHQRRSNFDTASIVISPPSGPR